MKCINFDRAFERYMAEWIKENSEKYKDDMDVIEDMMPDVYLEFLKKPADFLDGIAPQDYFEQFDNADMLVNRLCDYIAQGVPVPDLLLERVTALGKPAEKSLLALITRDDLPEETLSDDKEFTDKDNGKLGFKDGVSQIQIGIRAKVQQVTEDGVKLKFYLFSKPVNCEGAKYELEIKTSDKQDD